MLPGPAIGRRRFLLTCAAASAAVAKPTEAPTGPGSRAYALGSSADGAVYLVWIEDVDDGHVLRISRYADGAWGAAHTVAEGASEWFVNFADHPVLGAGPDGRVLVSWSYRPAAALDEKWGLAVKTAVSSDYGESWREGVTLGADNTADYSGFLGLSTTSSGYRAAYLAPALKGEAQRGAEHVKTLRFAELSWDGRLVSDVELDSDVCTCCPLDTANTADGPAVVYRDHAAGEIRDIAVVRRVGGRWSEPRPVHRDNWEINGCPVNGAAISASGSVAATAWFTAAQDEPRVLTAFSSNAAASFGKPVRVDGGNPAGWAGVALLDENRAAVSWLEKRADESGVGDLMLRIVEREQPVAEARTIATTGSGRSTGIPQITPYAKGVALAWREEGRVLTFVDPTL